MLFFYISFTNGGNIHHTFYSEPLFCFFDLCHDNGENINAILAINSESLTYAMIKLQSKGFKPLVIIWGLVSEVISSPP